jgi:hypothetical protein
MTREIMMVVMVMGTMRLLPLLNRQWFERTQQMNRGDHVTWLIHCQRST